MKRNRKKIIRLLIYVPFILIAYILQASVFSELPMGGAKPLILPVAVVALSMHGGRVRGGAFGLFAGMLCDTALCRPTILFTLLLTVAGITIGALFETVLTKGFPSYLLCCIALLLVSAFCQMFGLLFYHGAQLAALSETAAYQTLYSLIFTIPIYWLTRIISRTASRT
jgi:rod shape-determining protein MreD